MVQPPAELDELRAGEMIARLSVRIDDEPIAPACAGVRFALTLDGPSPLQVEPPRLEDAFAAWKIVESSSQRSANGRERIEWTLELAQLKPGLVPLPGLRWRVRRQPTDEWHDFFWPEPLHRMSDVAAIVELPTPPPSPWPGRAQFGCVLFALGLAFWLLLRRTLRRRLRSESIPPWQRAEADLAACPDLAAVGRCLRDFLQDWLGVSVTAQTTPELLSTLQRSEVPTERLASIEQILRQADLAKYAQLQSGPAELTQFRELAQQVVRSSTTWPGGKNVPSGKEG